MHNFGFILLNHFFGDFVCQSRMMGENKSHSLYWLTMHILAYTLALGVTSFWFFPSPILFAAWLALNSVLHFWTDFFTSKLSTYFYKKQKWYWFWKVIGGDQLIHTVILYYTSIAFGLNY